MITIVWFFWVGSVSYNGGKTHDRNSSRGIIMEIRRTPSITSGKDMLGTDEKKKKKARKRSLTCE